MVDKDKKPAPLLDGWIDIFRAGKQTSSEGWTHTWTEAELDSIVSNSKGGDPAPVIIGHLHETAPAWAWTGKLRRVGDRLQVRLKDIHDDFRQAVADNLYRNRSAAFRKTDSGYALHHVAFLGGAAPAVQGLEPVSFEEDGGDLFEFTMAATVSLPIEQLNALEQTFRSLREWIIERSGLDEADRILPSWRIGIFETPTETLHAERLPTMSLVDNNGDAEERLADITRREAENTRRDEEIKAREDAHNRKVALHDAGVKVDGHVAAGRILPAEREQIAAFMASLDDGGSDDALIEFSDGSDTRKVSQAKIFDSLLDALPKRVDYSENAPAGNAPPPETADDTIATKARTYHAEQRKSGNMISYAQAVDHIRTEMGVEDGS